jgi:hypothetical protein
VLPLDADNLLRPSFLASAVAVLSSLPETAAAYPDRQFIGRRTGEQRVAEPDLEMLCGGNYIDACALIRRDVLVRHGGWDSTLPTGGLEDWELWIRLLAAGEKILHLPIVGFDYRVRLAQMSHRHNDPEVLVPLVSAIVAKHKDVFAAHVETVIPRFFHALVDMNNRLIEAKPGPSRSVLEATLSADDPQRGSA